MKTKRINKVHAESYRMVRKFDDSPSICTEWMTSSTCRRSKKKSQGINEVIRIHL